MLCGVFTGKTVSFQKNAVVSKTMNENALHHENEDYYGQLVVQFNKIGN